MELLHYAGYTGTRATLDEVVRNDTMSTSRPRFGLAALILFVLAIAIVLGIYTSQRRTIRILQMQAAIERDRAEMAMAQAHDTLNFLQTNLATTDAGSQSTGEDGVNDRSTADGKDCNTAVARIDLATILDDSPKPTDPAQPKPESPPLADAAIDVAPVDSDRLTGTAYRMKQFIDTIPAIDTHDHLWPFDQLPGYVETDRGRGMNLSSIWRNSYYTWFNPLEPWKPGGSFDEWWAKAKHNFDNARATSFYRYQLPAFSDLYNVDFDRITDEQARELNDRIFEHYRDQRWLYHVVTERAN